MKEINWKEVQKFYDKNHFWNDVLKKFNINSYTLNKALKEGKFKSRTRSESAKIHSNLFPKKHSEETKKKISESRKNYLKNNPDKVPYLLNHSSMGDSYPEKYFKKIFNFKKLSYKFKYQFSVYELDFAFVDKLINIEIDGSQHKEDLKILKSNINRDNFMKENGWETIRIEWNKYQKLNKIEKKEYINLLIYYINNKENKVVPNILNKEKNQFVNVVT